MNGISGETLLACLSEVAPLELKGMALLRESRSHGAWFPVVLPHDGVREAVAEFIPMELPDICLTSRLCCDKM